jgi:hypothetical protein
MDAFSLHSGTTKPYFTWLLWVVNEHLYPDSTTTHSSDWLTKHLRPALLFDSIC